MKLNWAERWVVNNPSRVIQQWIEVKWLKRMENMDPGGTVLEVGCGRGAGARLVRKAFQPDRLLILDLDYEMMRRAKAYLRPEELEAITLYAGDAARLPFKDNAFDALFGFGFLHHVPDWRQALSEVARVLKPGGRYYIEELYPTLYQNVVTKRILLHPAHDRFRSLDLKTAMKAGNLHLKESFEIRAMGILGVAIKL
jgi:ubiquinone/menaquinone biosynthesis C-methylase UbiE